MAGERFFIEMWDGKNWQEVDLNYNFNALGYSIGSRGNTIFNIDMQPEIHAYKVGKYRVSKDVNANGKRYILTTEFILK